MTSRKVVGVLVTVIAIFAGVGLWFVHRDDNWGLIDYTVRIIGSFAAFLIAEDVLKWAFKKQVAHK